MPELLEVSGLDAGYGSTRVLHDVSLEVRRGRVTVVLGANGAGKTTTLRAICQMVRSSGRIRLDGVELVGRATESIVRRGIAHVPDGRGTFAELTVLENLKLGAITRSDRARVEADLKKAFARFPILLARQHQQAGTLSGGEQQMLAISRALMSAPRLLLLDEPSFGLAPKVVADIYSILRAVMRDEDMGMLLVEQNANLALDFADHAYLLETGRVVLSGPSALMKQDESIRRSYLGS